MSRFDFHKVSTADYYRKPPEDVFLDIQAKSIRLWQTYDDTHGYATEKVGRIKDLTNVSDNVWYMVAMFDDDNQDRLWDSLDPATTLYLETFMGVANESE